jgi:peptidoglycan biosynthesis protein MviN/MurJ (putative lipid II flippase)
MSDSSHIDDPAQRLIPGPVGLAIVGAVAAGVVAGLAGWVVGGRLAMGMGWAAWPAVGGVVVASLIALGVIRVWKARPMLEWMHALLICQGVRFVSAVALAGVLIYFLPSPARGVGGVTFAAGYLAVVFAESWVFARHFRRVLQVPAIASVEEDDSGQDGDS